MGEGGRVRDRWGEGERVVEKKGESERGKREIPAVHFAEVGVGVTVLPTHRHVDGLTDAHSGPLATLAVVSLLHSSEHRHKSHTGWSTWHWWHVRLLESPKQPQNLTFLPFLTKAADPTEKTNQLRSSKNGLCVNTVSKPSAQTAVYFHIASSDCL